MGSDGGQKRLGLCALDESQSQSLVVMSIISKRLDPSERPSQALISSARLNLTLSSHARRVDRPHLRNSYSEYAVHRLDGPATCVRGRVLLHSTKGRSGEGWVGDWETVGPRNGVLSKEWGCRGMSLRGVTFHLHASKLAYQRRSGLDSCRSVGRLRYFVRTVRYHLR